MSNLSKIGVSGMNAARARLEEISNNLANSATTGFKAGSKSFASMYVNNGAGSQGVGVKTNQTTYNMNAGTISNSEGRAHMAIGGEGFFVVQNESGEEFFTRAGDFEFDKEGVLRTADGLTVMGSTPGSADLEPITLGTSAMPPAISEQMDINVNLGGNAGMDSITTSLRVTDSLGERHDIYMTYDNHSFDATTGETTWDLTVELNGETMGPYSAVFDSNGSMIDGGNFTDGVFNLDFTTQMADPANAPLGVSSINIDMSGSTAYSGEMFFRETEIDGNTRGEMIDFEFSEKGELMTIFSNGEREIVSSVAMASFANINGLKPVSGNKFEQTMTSGEAEYGTSGIGGLGDINVGFLESSNVDTAKQLVDMIDAQQMYQSNSKSVSTNRELNQTLNNM